MKRQLEVLASTWGQRRGKPPRFVPFLHFGVLLYIEFGTRRAACCLSLAGSDSFLWLLLLRVMYRMAPLEYQVGFARQPQWRKHYGLMNGRDRRLVDDSRAGPSLPS
ncbi:hypothetical protein [Cupriavidus sp. M-11]|uniref:hypothetical protein n=1 Tax=Cupriavidus sp. M-11 TaxID=3233038 RepID=UPI003F8F136A